MSCHGSPVGHDVANVARYLAWCSWLFGPLPPVCFVAKRRSDPRRAAASVTQGANFRRQELDPAMGSVSLSGLSVVVRGRSCSGYLERSHASVVCEVDLSVEVQSRDTHLATVWVSGWEASWDLDAGAAPPEVYGVGCPWDPETGLGGCSTAGFVATVDGRGFGSDATVITVEVENVSAGLVDAADGCVWRRCWMAAGRAGGRAGQRWVEAAGERVREEECVSASVSQSGVCDNVVVVDETRITCDFPEGDPGTQWMSVTVNGARSRWREAWYDGPRV